MGTRPYGRGRSLKPRLPATVRTREGLTFDPRPDLWDFVALHGRLLARFDDIPAAHPDLVRSFKATLCWVAASDSLAYVNGIFWRFRTLLTFLSSLVKGQVRELTSIHLINFRSAGLSMEYELSGLAAFLKQWHRRGYGGVSADAVAFLRDAKLKSSPKGVAVATMDPRTGPLTDLELRASLEALTSALAARTIDLSYYLIAMFFILLAPRPIQLAAMKAFDLKISVDSDGTKTYALDVPRGKQRDKPRADSKRRPLPPQVGELVELHVRQVTSAWVAGGHSAESAPMFPSDPESGVSTPGFECHRTSASIDRGVVRVLKKLSPVSERTGERIVLNATRFRRTLATRALAAGYGLKVVAELLDHSDLQSVTVYAGLRPGIYGRIHRSTMYEVAPLVAAFLGELVATLPDGMRRITDPRADRSMRRPVGCCGTGRTCDFAAPVACYPCRSFRPWLDGPHEAVIERLLVEQERLRRVGGDALASALDRTIYAALEVNLRCRAHRADRKS